jgi:hypothetical protein
MYNIQYLQERKIQYICITKINLLMLFMEIIAVISENHMKLINALCGQTAELLIFKACGTYSYHWSSNG